MADKPTRGDVFEHFKKLAESRGKSNFFDDPAFENMTIKEANAAATQYADHLMRFAVDFHQSLSCAEREEIPDTALTSILRYVRHDDDCRASHTNGEEVPCSCGARVEVLVFKDALARLSNAVGKYGG